MNKNLIFAFSAICLLTSLSVEQAYAKRSECSTATCGCMAKSCSKQGHAGFTCVTNGHRCNLHGDDFYSCNQWCTTLSNVCRKANGQNGISECGTI